MEDRMKSNENFNIEDARMEWKISRMKWKTIFHTSFILDFAHGIYRKINTGSDDQKYVEAFNG